THASALPSLLLPKPLFLPSWVSLTAPSPNLPPSGLHSRHLLHTVVSEPGPGLPWYSRVAYVDDQVIFDYTSEKQRVEPRTAWMAQNEGPEFWDHQIFWARRWEAWFRASLNTLRELYNQTKGECGTRPDLGTWGHRDRAGEWQYTKTCRRTLQSPWPHNSRFKGSHTAAKNFRTRLQRETATLQFICKMAAGIKWSAPRVVHYWSSHDGLTTLSCKVSGFYPRDITVTWLKNGESRQQDTYSEGILPSGDGTYQTWVTIEIDPKIKANYSCHVEHESLLEPLSVSWGKEFSPASGGGSPMPRAQGSRGRIYYTWSCLPAIFLLG
uniref:Ig-like domain-containing protein n=1 Tax=Chelydra serpentina TaxID=8475 RepID=A0A8C3SRW8_CHESE